MATAPYRPASLRVLIVEDDDALRRREAAFLIANGLEVSEATDLRSARQMLDGQAFDVVVLDLRLGREDASGLLEELSERGLPPVVVTSVLGTEAADRVRGLEMGADDYLAKPFTYAELLARVRSVHRRANVRRTVAARTARFDTWTLDLSARVATHADGKQVVLTSGEMGILRGLLQCCHQVMSRQDLIRQTRRDDGVVLDRTVDALITRLRAKLEADPRKPEFIRTVRSVGYQFMGDVFWDDALPPTAVDPSELVV